MYWVKKCCILLFLFNAVTCSKADATPVEGQDYYAIQSAYWNQPATQKYSTPARALGNLHNTFGTSMEPIRALLSAVHPLYYRVHIINAVCIRNQNCGKYELGYGYTKGSFDAAVRARKASILVPYNQQVKSYCGLLQGFPGTHLVISPALEHDLSKQAWRVLADSTISVCAGVQLDNSPDGGVAVERYRGAFIERHGSSPQSDADIVSLDGADATQIDIHTFLVRARSLPNVKIIQLWTAGYNCRVPEWQDPRARKNCPSSKTLELMNHINEDYGQPPSFSGKGCKKMFAFRDPDIWKPLAESSPNPDPRQELPVLITKKFGKGNVTAISSRGTSVGTLGFYGTYLDQGYRYYSGYTGGTRSSGYELQKGAQADSASPFMWLQQNGTCAGPLLGGRRQGKMRDN